jgi:hypothetical protein
MPEVALDIELRD